MRQSIDFTDVDVNSYKTIPSGGNKSSKDPPKKFLKNTDTKYGSISLKENLDMLKLFYPDKFLFSIEETASILNVSYEFIRQRAAKKEIPTISFGDRRMINICIVARLLTNGAD